MSIYHTGEAAVQRRAGVEVIAEKVGRMVNDQIVPVAMAWLYDQQLIALASVSASGQVWASVLDGPAGFITAPDPTRAEINANVNGGTPLFEALEASEAALGAIVLEPATRRRMRLNGIGSLTPTGLEIRAQEVYSNCPKYIQTRSVASTQEKMEPQVSEGKILTPQQQDWIRQADTFFIATIHETAADCSHRGGNPGFVRVEENTLTWDDFAGNAMFNTLGNIEADPRCGLVFLDWTTGSTLQLTGEAVIVWHGRERALKFETHQWRETTGALTLHWQFGEYSPANPR